MNYFPFHVGDYAAHTRHLSLLEDLAYRRLLDAYYLSERPFNGSSTDVARMIGMREYAEAVDFVLRTFFVASEDGYRNARADREIGLFAAKRQQQSKAGKASAERRLNDRSTTVEPTRTNNQNQPSIRDTGKRKAQTPDRPADVGEQVWSDWLQHRRSKRAPVTETVLDGAKVEAQKAGMSLEDFLRVWCRRGSQGLEAAWLKPEERQQHGQQPMSFRERDAMAAAAEVNRITGGLGRRTRSSGEVIDITPPSLELPNA